jgi:hypothetical protein
MDCWTSRSNDFRSNERRTREIELLNTVFTKQFEKRLYKGVECIRTRQLKGSRHRSQGCKTEVDDSRRQVQSKSSIRRIR